MKTKTDLKNNRKPVDVKSTCNGNTLDHGVTFAPFSVPFFLLSFSMIDNCQDEPTPLGKDSVADTPAEPKISKQQEVKKRQTVYNEGLLPAKVMLPPFLCSCFLSAAVFAVNCLCAYAVDSVSEFYFYIMCG